MHKDIAITHGVWVKMGFYIKKTKDGEGTYFLTFSVRSHTHTHNKSKAYRISRNREDPKRESWDSRDGSV